MAVGTAGHRYHWRGRLISVFAMAQLGFLPPVVITAAYAFLSIRLEDTSILDFLRYAIRYFLLGQQTYVLGAGVIHQRIGVIRK